MGTAFYFRWHMREPHSITFVSVMRATLRTAGMAGAQIHCGAYYFDWPEAHPGVWDFIWSNHYRARSIDWDFAPVWKSFYVFHITGSPSALDEVTMRLSADPKFAFALPAASQRLVDLYRYVLPAVYRVRTSGRLDVLHDEYMSAGIFERDQKIEGLLFEAGYKKVYYIAMPRPSVRFQQVRGWVSINPLQGEFPHGILNSLGADTPAGSQP